MDEEEKFINILKENLLFMRHQETQRMWIANVFVAIVVGFLAYIGKEALVSKDALVSLPWYIYLTLIIISLLCLLITLKLNHVFARTKEATVAILKDKKIPSLGEGWGKYIVLLRSEGIWNIPLLSVRWLYIILYALATTGFSALWIYQYFLATKGV